MKQSYVVVFEWSSNATKSIDRSLLIWRYCVWPVFVHLNVFARVDLYNVLVFHCDGRLSINAPMSNESILSKSMASWGPVRQCNIFCVTFMRFMVSQAVKYMLCTVQYTITLRGPFVHAVMSLLLLRPCHFVWYYMRNDFAITTKMKEEKKAFFLLFSSFRFVFSGACGVCVFVSVLEFGYDHDHCGLSALAFASLSTDKCVRIYSTVSVSIWCLWNNRSNGAHVLL